MKKQYSFENINRIMQDDRFFSVLLQKIIRIIFSKKSGCSP